MEKKYFVKIKMRVITGILFMCISIPLTFAQQMISGTVTDENNQYIIGANIIVKGTTTEQLQILMETLAYRQVLMM